MIETTKEKFYERMGPLNVHPRPQRKETLWEMQDGSRRIVGRSTPGYDCTGREAYYLNEGATR